MFSLAAILDLAEFCWSIFKVPETSVFRSGDCNGEVEIQWSHKQWPPHKSGLAMPMSLAFSLVLCCAQ